MEEVLVVCLHKASGCPEARAENPPGGWGSLA